MHRGKNTVSTEMGTPRTVANQHLQTKTASLFWIFQTIGSANADQFSAEIDHYLNQLQRNQREKQLIEISLKSLVRIWVTFPLPTILIFHNNAIRSAVKGHVRIMRMSLVAGAAHRERLEIELSKLGDISIRLPWPQLA